MKASRNKLFLSAKHINANWIETAVIYILWTHDFTPWKKPLKDWNALEEIGEMGI